MSQSFGDSYHGAHGHTHSHSTLVFFQVCGWILCIFFFLLEGLRTSRCSSAPFTFYLSGYLLVGADRSLLRHSKIASPSEPEPEPEEEEDWDDEDGEDDSEEEDQEDE